MREDFLALSYAISCSAGDAPVEESGLDGSFELFQLMANVSSRSASLNDSKDDQLAALISRATNAYCDLPGNVTQREIDHSTDGVSFEPSSIMGILFSAVTVDIDRMHESVCDIDVKFSPVHVVKHVAQTNRSSIVHRFRVILESLVCVGRIVAQKAGKAERILDDESFDFNLFLDIFKTGISFLRQNIQKEAVCAILTAMFSFISTKSVLWNAGHTCRLKKWNPQERVWEIDKKWAVICSFSSKVLSEALDMLNGMDPELDVWNCVSLSITPAIILLQFQIGANASARPLDKNELLDCLQRSVRGLTVADASLPIVSTAKDIAETTLICAIDFMKAEGDTLQAFELANLGRQCAGEQDNIISFWFKAASCFFEGNETIVTAPYDPYLVKRCMKQDLPHPELDVIASQLRKAARVVSLDKDNGVLKEDLLSLWQEVELSKESCTDDMIRMMLSWCRSTIGVSLAEILCRQGDNKAALYFAKEGYRSCQSASTSFASFCKARKRENMTHLLEWRRVLTDTTVLRLKEREIECRRRVADLYLLTGDWKKALQFICSASRLGCYEWFSDSDSLSDFHKMLVLSRSMSSENNQDLQLRRAFLRILAKTATADQVVEGLVSKLAVDGCWDQVSQKAGDVDWELESILWETDGKSWR